MADALSEIFESALALSVLAPPRTGKAQIEAIYDSRPDEAVLGMRLEIMASAIGIRAPPLCVRQLPRLDWLKKVAEDFPPLPIARWVVFGAQHKQVAKTKYPTKILLQIDATSAFGTGEHPTTRGCLLMLDKLLRHRQITRNRRKPRMLDVGCGSGILGMAWAKTTRQVAVGIDMDDVSVAIAMVNVAANGLRPYARFAKGMGYMHPLTRKNKPYDLIMANIFAGPLCQMAYKLKQHLRPGGVAILSGILKHQANRVIVAHRMQGLYLMQHIILGEWSVLALKRPDKA